MASQYYQYFEPDYDNRNVEGYEFQVSAEDDETGEVYITTNGWNGSFWDNSDINTAYSRHYIRNSSDWALKDTCIFFQGKNGYVIDSIEVYTNSAMTSPSFTATPNSNGLCTVYFSNGTNTTHYLKFNTHKENYIEYDLNNCVINDSSSTVAEATTIDYIITANDYCTFDSENPPYIEVNEEKTYFILSEDLTEATLTYTFVGAGETYTIVASAENTANTVNFDLTNCTIAPSDTIVPKNSIVDYKITTVNSGNYPTYFYTTPYIEVDDIKTDFKVNDDLTEATLTVEFNSGKTYKIVAEADRKNCTVTVDSDNCYFEDGTTFAETGTTKAGTTIYVFARANSGYYFTDEESINMIPSFIDTKTGDILANITLSEKTTISGTDYYSYAYYSYTIKDDTTIYIHAINPDDFVYCSCTENLTNVYTHSHADTYLKGSRATIEVYVPSAYTSVYKINDLPEIQFANGNVLYFEVAEDGLTASITFTVEDDFVIYAHAEKPKVYHNVIAENLTHCKLTSADTFEESEYYTLELTADDGYVFNDNIECWYNTLTTYITGDEFYEDDTIARHTFIPTLWSDIIVVEAVAIRQAEQVSNFAHLYKVTASILNSLAKVRFYEVSSESAEVVDYGEYITNLMEIPFTLPDDIIGDNANIQLGTFDSGVSAPTLLYHTIDIDIGNISVKSKYDNVYDYKDTEAILHLPYAEDITVPLEYVMNEELNIMYRMDLYSGDVTIILTSTYTGTVVATQNTNICTQIPFIQYQTDSVMNKIDKLTDNGIRTAFIELKRNIPYNVFCEFGKPTVDYGKLSDYKGYVEVSDCTVNIACTKDEQDLIKQTLKTGIIIK